MTSVIVFLSVGLVALVSGVIGGEALIKIGEARERRMWIRFLKDHQGMSVAGALACMLDRDHPHED